MNESEQKVKFPFEPNEKVKAAFRQETALKVAVQCITEALVTTTARPLRNPWKVLFKEHPEVYNASKNLIYDQITDTVDIKVTNES